MGYKCLLCIAILYAMPERKVYHMDTNLFNTKPKDSSAKLIFGDAVLCAQFLRGYVDIPLLKNVQAEDIEDVTERYVHMFTEERNSDIVKRVQIKNKETTTPFYLISLIEHKNNVDYNVVMQIFRYMAFIWEDYEREQEKRQEGISKTKNFRYPPILPIVFYDGIQNWTAPTKLHDRVLLSSILGKYIPDYQCMLLQLKDYSNKQLMEKKDEISIMLMIDKLQDMADFINISNEIDELWLKEVTKNSPEYLLGIMAQVIEGLLSKLNVPSEEIMEYTQQIKERRMGEWLSNFKGYDVQAARKQMREEARREVREEILEEVRQEALEEIRQEIRQKVRQEVQQEIRQEVRQEIRQEIRQETQEEALEKFIRFGKKHGISKETVEADLKEQYSLKGTEAAEKVALYWPLQS